MKIVDVTKLYSTNRFHSISNDDVFIDRLNHRYTVNALVIFSGIILLKEYWGRPIDCWVPAQWKKNDHPEYISSVCWVMNTYFIPMNETIPEEPSERYRATVKYYQWTWLILACMAVGFYWPRLMWRSLNQRSGINIQHFVKNLLKKYKADVKDPIAQEEKAIASIVSEIQDLRKKRTLYCQKVSRFRRFFLNSKLFLLFISMKVFFMVNCIAQLIFLNLFLGEDYSLYGFEYLRYIFSTEQYFQSKIFPRITLCDFNILELGIVHRYTVQCLLPINLFNEKIFLILWFWISLLSAVNFVDLCFWFYRLANPISRSRYIEQKTVQLLGKTASRSQIKSFARKYLSTDVVLALRLIARNGWANVVERVLLELFRAETESIDSEISKSELVTFRDD